MDIERLLATARFRATSFGVVNAKMPWGVQAPDMGYAIIYGVIRGPIWFECGEYSSTLNSGDIVMLPHGEGHRLTSGADVETVEPLMKLLRRKPGIFVFNHGGKGSPIQFIAGGSIWDEAAKAVIARLLPEVIIIRKDQIHSTSHIPTIEEMVVKEGLSPRSTTGLIVNGLFNTLLTEVLSIVLSSTQPKNMTSSKLYSGKILRALLLIHSSTSDAWTGVSLAQRVGLSRSAFSKKFQQETGLSPGTYLKKMRLQKAADLLWHSDVSIADAADHAGYASLPSFCQAFKAEFGTTPHAWRHATAQ